MITSVLFDMDGVLVHSELAMRTAGIYMFRELGVEASHEDFMEFTGMGENAFLGGVARKHGLEYELSMKARAYEIYAEIANELVEVFPGIRELVLELKRTGFRVAVASASDAVKVGVNLRCIGLSADDFDGLVTGSDVTRHKPDPEGYLMAAEKIGSTPGECLVVEDAVSGCMAAIAAGMVCVGVRSTFGDAALKKAGAFATVANTPEILELLRDKQQR